MSLEIFYQIGKKYITNNIIFIVSLKFNLNPGVSDLVLCLALMMYFISYNY